MPPKPNGIPRRKAGHPLLGLRGRGNAAALPQSIDLVHVTAVGAARDIVRSGQIDSSRCSVFDKELIYLFVARPAYRFKDGGEKVEEINRFPFVFVLSPDNLGEPYHVYPFDTGAAASGVFSELTFDYVYLDDYELAPSLEAAAAHIDWAFGNAEAYFDGALRQDFEDNLLPWEDVAKGFIRIARLASSGHNKPDKRASAIEVAYRRNIPLSGNVRFAIIPKQYLEHGSARNTDFIDRMRDLGINWDVYDWRPNEAPDFYSDDITRLVRKYLKRTGQL